MFRSLLNNISNWQQQLSLNTLGIKTEENLLQYRVRTKTITIKDNNPRNITKMDCLL